MDTPTTALRNLQCPTCKNDITVGIGIAPPEILYTLLPQELEKRKKEFIDLLKKSTMPDEQKNNLLKIYGRDDIMLDPVMMANMVEELKKNYIKTGEENKESN